MKTNHIEVWYDETSDSDEPVYCVSLCEADGEEITLLCWKKDRASAETAGRKAAKKRGVEVMYREKHGQTVSL